MKLTQNPPLRPFLEKFAKLLRSGERFLITTHSVPDGDGLGSEMALHFFLKKSGKISTIVNTHETPQKFRIVDPRNEIQVYDPSTALPKVDRVFVLDTNEHKMLGALEAPIRALGVPVTFIDHHVPELEDPENHLVDEQFGSTGELVYTLLRECGADIDQEMAMGIYVAIVTDTGSFRFKRTTARSHLITADLLQKGISPEKVYQHIYARDSFGKTRLLGHLLQSIKTSPDERIAWFEITKEMRHQHNASIDDTETFVNKLTLIEGVDIGMLFREEDDGRIKVSVRGNGEIPAIGIAKKFGGGGHRHAAGAKVQASLAEVVQMFYDEAAALLKGYPTRGR